MNHVKIKKYCKLLQIVEIFTIQILSFLTPWTQVYLRDEVWSKDEVLLKDDEFISMKKFQGPE